MAISGIGGIALPAAATAPAPTAPDTAAGGAGSAGGKGFGNMLANELGKLDQSQAQASTAAEQVATGQATDISSVAMQVEEASLSLQLATQVRDKAVDAYNELFGMQI
jgi:flagellar hook-basal body complex protein FliE